MTARGATACPAAGAAICLAGEAVDGAENEAVDVSASGGLLTIAQLHLLVRQARREVLAGLRTSPVPTNPSHIAPTAFIPPDEAPTVPVRPHAASLVPIRPDAAPLVPIRRDATPPSPTPPSTTSPEEQPITWVLGGAGGAGETCLAAALTAVGCPAAAAGHRWPTAQRAPQRAPRPTAQRASPPAAQRASTTRPASTQRRPSTPRPASTEPPSPPACVVLVARTTLASLHAAQQLAGQWASGAAPGVRVLGLAVLADAPGRTPRALAEFVAVLGGGLPAVWRIGWQPDWRLTAPDGIEPARPLRAQLHPIVTAIRAATASLEETP